jgi:pimeloyl-ACP methyl ester carboxylesterase
MPYVTVGKENGTDIDLYYKDWGRGQPIVFSHGWPLSADDWDPQMLFCLSKGYRVIAHDRRGHGRSTQVADGHKFLHPQKSRGLECRRSGSKRELHRLPPQPAKYKYCSL